jgi:ribosomal protein S27E
MGVFSKVMCIECHHEVGLNRYKVKGGGWLCPACMKKLKDGFGLFRTIEEIRAKASSKLEAKKEAARELLGIDRPPPAADPPATTVAPDVGAPVVSVNPTQPQCPKCLSYQTTYSKQGFSAGKAAAGLLLAPGGVLWGFHGKNRIIITCMKCGHQWKVG